MERRPRCAAHPDPAVRGPHRRVAVIGAGAAGVSAAHYLRRKGYARVTLFDRLPRVGGKCHTEVVDGRSYERGALVVGGPYRRVRALVAEAGLRIAPFPPIKLLDTRQPHRLRRADAGLLRAPVGDLLRLLAAWFPHGRCLCRPGYGAAERAPLACATMGQWLRRHRLGRLAGPLAPYLVGWGYGYLEWVGALYVWKLLNLYLRGAAGLCRPIHRCPPLGYLPAGYQKLWEILAAPFERRLGAAIHAVRREPDGVAVEFDGRRRVFDALILACPLPQALAFLDAHPLERALISRIRTFDFHSLTAEVAGLPPDPLVFVANYLTPSAAGHMVSWYRRWPDSDRLVFYALGESHSAASVEDVLRQDLQGLGARMESLRSHDRWDYFPHIDPADTAVGFYRDLESLQGRFRTWYTGESLTFPTVEDVVDYSHHLVAEHF